MPHGWEGSDRRARLPADWPKRRKRILRRDGWRCTHRNEYGERCAEEATDVDHCVPGDDHGDHNLRSLCDWHHQKKSSREGAVALAKKRRKIRNKFRRTEKHPGLL